MYWSEGRLRAVMGVDSGNLVFINHAVKFVQSLQVQVDSKFES